MKRKKVDVQACDEAAQTKTQFDPRYHCDRATERGADEAQAPPIFPKASPKLAMRSKLACRFLRPTLNQLKALAVTSQTVPPSVTSTKPAPLRPVTAAQVRADFNDVRAVLHYTKAAHNLGLWTSERLMLDRILPPPPAADFPILEAGCGAGRVAVALHALGYQHLTGFDFARELVDQAVSLAAERHATITFHHADATKLNAHPAFASAPSSVGPGSAPFPGAALGVPPEAPSSASSGFAAVLFLFNGLMQIPLRSNRRRALRQLATVCRPGAPLLFTTHDRDHSPSERASWRIEARRWAEGKQDPRLREFGDRRFEDHCGDTFMHLPDRAEILADIAATGWTHVEDHLRRDLAKEPRPVRDFSDECRFWVARRPVADEGKAADNPSV